MIPISLLEFLDRGQTQIDSHGRHILYGSLLLSLFERRLVVAHGILVNCVLGGRGRLDEFGAEGVVLVEFLVIFLQLSLRNFDDADEFVSDGSFGMEGDNSRFVVGWC